MVNAKEGRACRYPKGRRSDCKEVGLEVGTEDVEGVGRGESGGGKPVEAEEDGWWKEEGWESERCPPSLGVWEDEEEAEGEEEDEESNGVEEEVEAEGEARVSKET